MVISENRLANSPVYFPQLVAEETPAFPAQMASRLQEKCYDYYSSGLGACPGYALFRVDCGCASRDSSE
jgi:hypothetical protein